MSPAVPSLVGIRTVLIAHLLFLICYLILETVT